MSYTFPASAKINNVRWPYSFGCFGTRPNDTASADLIYKGSGNSFQDNSGVVSNEMRYLRTTSAVDIDKRTTTTFKVADGNTHVFVTVSASGAAKIYKNGVECSYRSTSDGVGTLTSDAASDLIFNLDNTSHCVLYNIELSAAEISALYNGGNGTNCYNVRPASILVTSDPVLPLGNPKRPIRQRKAAIRRDFYDVDAWFNPRNPIRGWFWREWFLTSGPPPSSTIVNAMSGRGGGAAQPIWRI